jgi:tetratricopeptide (TPR) repeat protein
MLIGALLSACTTLAPEPTATPSPESTATPIPPTLTPSPGDLLEAGWQAYATADLDAAREIVERVMEQFPEDGEAYVLLGAILVEQGDLIAAIEQLEISRQMGYEDADTVFLLSESYLSRSSQIIDEIYSTWDYEEILDLIYEARVYLEKEQDLGLGTSERAEALYAWFNRPMEDLPATLEEGSPAFTNWQAAIDYEQAGNRSAAIAEMETATINDPENALLYNKISELYAAQENYAAALGNLLAALELNPNLYLLHSDLGFLFSFQFLPLHAREAFITAMLADPENERSEEGLYVLGLTLGSWDSTHFLDYGFRFTLPPDGEFKEMPEMMNNSPEEGIGGYMDSSTVIGLMWMPISESAHGVNASAAEIVSTPPLVYTTLGEVTAIGEPLVFEYNTVPITYQPFMLIPGGQEEHATLTIYATWQCGETRFILNQMISQNDPNYLFMFNPGLESVTCDLDSIIPEHP